MTIKDLEAAVAFLRKMTVGQMEVDLLIQTVEALETEIKEDRVMRIFTKEVTSFIIRLFKSEAK